MTTGDQPELWVFAGPNGAGKTTLFDETLRGSVEYVNADEIARDHGLASSSAGLIRAGRMAVERRIILLQQRQNLSIETTLSGNSAIMFMRRAKAAGYIVHFAFVGIDTPELSRARIDQRVASGGHDVPQDAVVRRHPDAMRKLATAMALVDTTMVFDNSTLERCLLLIHKRGKTEYVGDSLPGWFNQAAGEVGLYSEQLGETSRPQLEMFIKPLAAQLSVSIRRLPPCWKVTDRSLLAVNATVRAPMHSQ